jgi:hypothetical protein
VIGLSPFRESDMFLGRSSRTVSTHVILLRNTQSTAQSGEGVSSVAQRTKAASYILGKGSGLF